MQLDTMCSLYAAGHYVQSFRSWTIRASFTHLGTTCSLDAPYYVHPLCCWTLRAVFMQLKTCSLYASGYVHPLRSWILRAVFTHLDTTCSLQTSGHYVHPLCSWTRASFTQLILRAVFTQLAKYILYAVGHVHPLRS